MLSTKILTFRTLYLRILGLSHQEKKHKFFKIKQGIQQKIPIIYPQQYPTQLADTTPIITRQRPVRHITPKYQIPNQKLMDEDQLIKQTKYQGKWASPQNAHVLNVGLIGPVNAGKSQLFGALGHRISAVSSKASTTTQIITGIKSFQRQSQEGIKNIQLVYYDTPGLMYKKQGFISKGWKVLSQIDFSLLVVDSAKRFDDMTKQSIKRLQKHREYPNFMKALVLNKIDIVDNRRKFDQLIRQIQKYGKFDKIFHVSAKTGYGIQQLQQYLLKMAKPGQWQYASQTKTTLTKTQIYQQLLRQGIFNRAYKQVPHDVDIQCTSFSALTNNKDQLIFNIYVQSQNQQRMIIGKQGSNIKQIMDKFKLQYAKLYARQAQPICAVRIRNSFRKRFRGRQQNIVDDLGMENKQILGIAQENLRYKRITGVTKSIDIGTQKHSNIQK